MNNGQTVSPAGVIGRVRDTQARWRPRFLPLAFAMTVAAVWGLKRLRFVGDPTRFHRTALWTGVFAILVVYFSFGSVELMAAALVPVALGLLWAVGLMEWINLPLDAMTSPSTLLIFGAAICFSVFLVRNKLDEWQGREKRFAAMSGPVLVCAFATMAGFCALEWTRHPAFSPVGLSAPIELGFTFAAAFLLTPLCMDLLLFKPPPRGAPRWWHPLGTIWVILHLGGSQVFLYYILRPILKLASPATADDRLRRATRWMARGVVKGLPFGRLEFRNITKATFSPPCIVISNHQSAVDVMLVVSLPGDVRQTAKKRVFDAPMLGIGCKLLGHVMVEPNDPDITLRRCRERLTEGACVHFYPEGTRSFDGFVDRFHRGAFELAVQLKQEILPIILCDTNTAMPRDSYWFEPYHALVSAIPRITPQTFDYSLGSLALMRHCEQIVRDALQKHLDEVNIPRVVRRKVNRLYRYQGKFVEQFVYWKMKTDPVFEALDEIVPRRGEILDLGCGYGIASHWLACFSRERTFLGADYDEHKIRVAQRTALENDRIRFEKHDILEWDFPSCDAILLLDVLHYWTPEKQQAILDKIRRALRPGGRLILREAARADSEGHQRVEFWEKIATRIRHNRTKEGLHFQTLARMEESLRRAGFANLEIKRGGGRDSNILLVATAGPIQ